MLYELLKILQDYSLINDIQCFIDLTNDDEIKFDLLLLQFKKQENKINFNESKNAILEILNCARLIKKESKKCFAFKEIAHSYL